MNFKTIMVNEKKSDTKDSYYMTVFIWNSRKDKTIVTESRLVVGNARGEEEGNWMPPFWSDGYVLYLHCGGDQMILHICQNSLTVHLNWSVLLYKLYPKSFLIKVFKDSYLLHN